MEIKTDPVVSSDGTVIGYRKLGSGPAFSSCMAEWRLFRTSWHNVKNNGLNEAWPCGLRKTP
jgi:hypothetical protein